MKTIRLHDELVSSLRQALICREDELRSNLSQLRSLKETCFVHRLILEHEKELSNVLALLNIV